MQTAKLIYSVNTNNQDKKPNETNIYRHPSAIGKQLNSFLLCQTIHNIYTKILETPEKPLFGRRLKLPDGAYQEKYSWFKTQKVFETAERIGSGLINLKLVNPIKEWKNYELTFVGMYSSNTVRYLTTDIACCLYNFTIVPIYDTLGEGATNFAFEQTKMNTIFISSKHIDAFLAVKKERKFFQSLQNLIILDSEDLSENYKEKYKNEINIFTFEEIFDAGQQIHPWAEVTPNSIYAFSYTSGTTGDPKGAMISHLNVCSCVSSSRFKIKFFETDVYMSYLPMAHVMERIIFNCLLYYGARIGVFNGNSLTLMDDLKILKPTVFLSVPRIFNKIYDKMVEQIEGSNFMVKSLVNSAIKSKQEKLFEKAETNHWFYDSVFFKKVREKLGGRVRVILTGSAPISGKILDFLKVTFSCPLVEGYGQTEACALEFATEIQDGTSGHVGGPVPQNEFKLVDVPELDYKNDDKDEQGNLRPRGEIWVRGVNVIPGYYKLDEKNKETFTEDGWMQSGDIGQLFLPEGKMQVIDRKKNIFKLSQGEYIAPEKLENAYINAHTNLQDIFVYGSSMQSCLIAFLNFTEEGLQKMKDEYGLEGENAEEELKKILKKKFEEIRIASKFNSLEKIADFVIDTKNWSDLDLMTTTMKKKRHLFQKMFAEKILEIYSNLG